jgi:hypothetical protein
MNEAQLSSYIKEILKSKKIKEGTCGYGIDGEPGNKPAGPYLTSEGISPEVADKAEQIKNTMISKNRDKLFKMYGKDAEKVATGRAVIQAKKSVDEKLGKSADVGDYKDDFRKSNAPQFKGKSKKKRDQMATAAFLNKEDLDVGHQDNEPNMLKAELARAGKMVQMLYKAIDKYDGQGEVDFPQWWQKKIIQSNAMLDSAFDYLDGQERISQIDAIMEKEEKLPVNDIKKAIKALLKKEGGAAGLAPILKLAKDFDNVTQIDIEDILDNDMKDVEKHRDGDYILKEDAQEKSEKNYSNYFKKMDKNRLEEFVKEALKNPKAADLNKDGKLSSYEKTRGAAIEKNLEEQEKEKEFSAIKAILADLNDKLPQFKTIDTPQEFMDLMEELIDLIISQSPDFIESGRFIAAMLQLYNKRKDFQKKAKSQGDKNVDDPVLKDLADKGITSTADARNAGFRLNSAQKKALANLEESKKKVDEGSLSDKIENSEVMKALEKAAEAAKVSGNSFKKLMDKFNAELASIKSMEENKKQTSLSERIFKELKK